jgi:hypothetical protein
MFKHRIGSGQGQVVGHLAQNAPDPCIVSGQGGLVHASLLDVSCRVFSSWIRGFGFGSGFFGLGRVLGQKSRLVPGPWIIMSQKLWLMPIRCIGRVGSGSSESG